MKQGTPLPSIRAVSKDLEISVIITRRAYQNLEIGGFIKTIQGKGTFVADVQDALKQIGTFAKETLTENYRRYWLSEKLQHT